MIMDSEDHSAGDEGEYSSTWSTMMMSTLMDPILHENSSGCDAGGGGGGRGYQHQHDKKRRFSEEQIKSLESMFETQTKLEPRQKLQLARELGLQPRQVAIWFQNKRARWKSKQLERQYTSLRKDYDSLLHSFESLKKEKQLLLKQLQSLAELLEKPSEQTKKEGDPNNQRDEDASVRESRQPKDEEEQDFHDGQIASTLSTSVPKQQQQQLYLQSTWTPLEESSTSSQWWEFWPLNE